MSERLYLELVPAPDDSYRFSKEFQVELEKVDDALRHRQLEVTSIIGHPGGDGTHLGQILVTLGPAVVGALGGVIGAWLQAKFGRKVRLKIGDIEGEARTIEELKELLEYAETFRRKFTDHEGGP